MSATEDRSVNMQDYLTRLTAVFRDVFDDDSITLRLETTARDIDGWDSVANIRLMVAIESEFRIKFDVGEYQEFRNIGELVAGVQQRV
jgi:acyl carrier protein